MITKKKYIKRKGQLKGNPKHTGSIQEALKGKNKKKKGYKKLISPHLEPNQSKKLIKGKGPTSIHDLDQNQRLYAKKYFFI